MTSQANTIKTTTPIRFTVGRGFNVSGSGLFVGGDDQLVMYPTKKMAGEIAKSFGWKKSDLIFVYTPIFAGYAVGQVLSGLGEVRFQSPSGSWVDVPFVREHIKVGE